MAIAHLRYRAGDVSRSADALDSILTAATDGEFGAPEDPWTRYLNGHLRQGSTLRDDLRRKAQR
jgi:hypothetical protein